MSLNIRLLNILLVSHPLTKKMEAYRSRSVFRVEKAFFFRQGSIKSKRKSNASSLYRSKWALTSLYNHNSIFEILCSLFDLVLLLSNSHLVLVSFFLSSFFFFFTPFEIIFYPFLTYHWYRLLFAKTGVAQIRNWKLEHSSRLQWYPKSQWNCQRFQNRNQSQSSHPFLVFSTI